MCRIMEDLRNESLKEGIKEGIKEGMKKGMKEGMKKGIREGMRESALRMLTAGKYALEEIANISGLSLEEVNQLKTGQNA